MAGQMELLLEAERRGILPPDKQGLLDEARKRQLTGEVKDPPTPLPDVPPSTGVAQDVGRFFTGEGKREFDLPELGTSGESVPVFKYDNPTVTDPETGKQKTIVGGYGIRLNPKATKMMGAYATSIDPKGIADIAVKTLPGASQWEDKHGNPIVTFEGEHYYVNDPGISEGDFFQMLAQIGAFAPAAKGAMAGSTLFKQMVRMGIFSATTSVASDVVAGQLGSEQGIDYTRAGLTGALGFAVQGLVPGVVAGWRGIFGKPQFFDEASGKLSPLGIEAARKAGLDPVDMTRRLAKAFAEEIVDEPSPALAVARANEKAFGIGSTRGAQQAREGDYSQLTREEGMRLGLRGETAQKGMAGVDERLLEQNIKAMGTATGRAARPLEEVGEEVSTGVQQAEVAKRAAKAEAYEAADPLIKEARVNKDNFSSLMRNVRGAVKELGLDKESHPKTINTLRRLGSLFKKTKKDEKLDITQVSLGKLERERRIINLKLKSAKGEDRHALLELKGAMDDWMDAAFDEALFTGNQAALKAIKNARLKAGEYYSLFVKQRGARVPDEVGAAVEKILYSDATPEMTINYIFGRSKLGRKLASTKIVERMKLILGEESKEMDALKDAAWSKLVKGREGRLQDPAAYVKNFDELLTENKSLLNALYTPDEIAVMKGVRDAIKATNVELGGAPARKAGIILGSIQRVFHWRGTAQAVLHKRPLYGSLLHIIGRNLPVLGEGLQSTAVKRAGTLIPCG